MYVDKSGEEIVEELYASRTKAAGRCVDAGTDADRRPDGRRQATGAIEADQVGLFPPVLALRAGPTGRFREFYQTNVDIFGSAEPTADAEILAVAVDMLTDSG